MAVAFALRAFLILPIRVSSRENWNGSMWRWDQGRLAYFQFDRLKAMARLAIRHDLKVLDKAVAKAETGLPFLPDTYPKLWRNYSRTLKLALIVYDDGNQAIATPIAHMLAEAGTVTSDEYFHFIARTFTDPSPALKGWSPQSKHRYPLMFTLKYGFVKFLEQGEDEVSVSEILSAYATSGFSGAETYAKFASLLGEKNYTADNKVVVSSRQARESLKTIAQISYLHYGDHKLAFSLDTRDAKELFPRLEPMPGAVQNNAERELARLADLASSNMQIQTANFKNTALSDMPSYGFKEGTKTKRTHIAIERNAKLRSAYFQSHATSLCDACGLDVAKRFPWAPRLLEIHHLLPLSSGTRVVNARTSFEDLAPLCPTCHRAVHRYYDAWLNDRKQNDFNSIDEARNVYGLALRKIRECRDA